MGGALRPSRVSCALAFFRPPGGLPLVPPSLSLSRIRKRAPRGAGRDSESGNKKTLISLLRWVRGGLRHKGFRARSCRLHLAVGRASAWCHQQRNRWRGQVIASILWWYLRLSMTVVDDVVDEDDEKEGEEEERLPSGCVTQGGPSVRLTSGL